MTSKRCAWVEGKPEFYLDYHDYVWGKVCHDDRELFTWLCLEIFHTGLSWQIILQKKPAFLAAFDHFDFEKVAAYDEEKIQALLANAGIVRHRKKIEATIHNAKCIQQLIEQYGSFDAYIWSFTQGQVQRRPLNQPVQSRNELSDRLAKDLKQKGFKWIGTTTIYSYLQGIGVINDHDHDCDFQ